MRLIKQFFVCALLYGLISEAVAIDIAQKPVFLNPPDPRIMLVMSRDHELSKKAYNDYSDLNGDGVLEVTYADSIDYYGYFNPRRCYIYNNTSGSRRFEPAGLASGANSHHCNGSAGEWSGNFLNWVSMTRMDVLRKTLYGGLRSNDNTTGTALGDTVLERAMLPDDVHAFAKVFAPAAGATEVLRYTPYNQAAVSFCNLTDETSGFSRAANNSPKLLVAIGSFPLWAMTENPQCATGSGDQPASVHETRVVRVAVCVPNKLEDNCTLYGSNNYKPTGLLQKYGEQQAAARVQFGLLTGSYSKNKSGGVLRKNTSLLNGNPTAANNEIDANTGQFINQTATDPGIINTINRIRISGWDYSSSPRKHQNSCNQPGILNFTNGQCVDWGNPLSEMYLETLRYFAGKTAPTIAFDSDTNEQTHLPSLPKVSWTDPLPIDNWCALSNSVILSTGLNSFDTDELGGHGITGLDPIALTNTVGDLIGLSGNYMIGSNGATSDNQCNGKSLTSLSAASGICPEVPSLQGGYHLAGLAYSNQNVDLRQSYQTKRERRWGPNSPSPNAARVARQPMSTYSVALAESLPKLTLSVSGGNISFLPACMANSDGNATNSSSNWRVCSLTDLRFIDYTTVNGEAAGTIEVAWEDSTWGNDYDMDGVQRISFCVGARCATSTNSNQVRFRTLVTRTAAGHAIRFGFTVTGSTNDGTFFPVLIPGGSNVSTDTPPFPTTTVFTRGTSDAKLLESPLWYAARFGKSDWDTKGGGTNKDQPDGIPDNYFKVTNPAGLFDALGKVFEEAAAADASASAIASNSTRLNTDTHVYQAVFHSPAWTGQLKAIPLSATGSAGTASWDASTRIPAHGSRNIVTWNGDQWNSNTGTGLDFKWSDPVLSTEISSAQQTDLGSRNILNYLRGDQTKEQNQTNGVYRIRSSLLGDIVNSNPHYVSNENYGYDSAGSNLAQTVKDAYTTFRIGSYVNGVFTPGTKATRKKMLYVGANDGMLHGFNAENSTSDGGGQEVLAYVPSAVISNLSILANPNYQHRYFVDGNPNSGDAYINGSWRTILLGTLGAGGKSVSALDITNPDDFDRSKVIWELTDAIDLGFINGRAHVARMNNGHWYAIFGNGYNSTSRKAVLFLVPLDRSVSPALSVIKIDTGVASDNGLSEPTLLDTDGDTDIDLIYAGDLKGNLWKFDMTSSSASSWDVEYQTSGNPAPLFTAQIIVSSTSTRQPITGAVRIGRPPAGRSGYMIYFGTGKYLGNSDVGTTQTQTVYGILDSGSKVPAGTSGRSNLVAQTFIYEGVFSSSNNTLVREVSRNSVDYTVNSIRGWYIDLLPPSSNTSVGERVITPVLLRHGRIIFTSIVPSSSPCSQGGYTWITELDALSGARLGYSVFDINGDNSFNRHDSRNGNDNPPISSLRPGEEGLMDSPTVISAGEKEYKVGSGTAGGLVVIQEKGMNSKPRLSWRQILPQ